MPAVDEERRPPTLVKIEGDVSPTRRDRAHPAALTSILVFLPAAAVLTAFVAWPTARILFASVTDGDHHWVGFRHFRAVLDEEGTWAVVGRTLLWGAVVPAVVASLGLGLALATRRGRTGYLARVALVLPIGVPLVVTGVMFRLLYDPDPTRGPVSGLTGVSFLGPRLVTLALMSAFVWAWVGLAVAVFRTAIEHGQPELADVVRVHGGSRRDVFLDAAWRPVLRRTWAVVFALVALATMRSFDLILVMAPGSSLDEASVLSVRQWQTSTGTTTGPGAALGVVWLTIVTLAVAGAAWWTRQRWPPPLVAAGAAGPADAGGSRSSLRQAARRTLLGATSLFWLVPLVVLAGTAFHAPNDAALHGWWSRTGLGGESFRTALRGGDLGRSLLLSGALAVVVTVVVTVLGLSAAYALAWAPSRSATFAGMGLLAAAVVPVQVIAGPINEMLRALQLSDTSIGLGLVHIALGLPFAILLLRNALSDVDLATLRRARLAGGRRWRVMWEVAPSAVTTAIAVAALEFVQVWNDFVVGLLFGGPNAVPLGVLVHGQSRQFVTNSGPLAATSVLACLVPLAVVVVAHRKIVSGLVSGALR